MFSIYNLPGLVQSKSCIVCLGVGEERYQTRDSVPSWFCRPKPPVAFVRGPENDGRPDRVRISSTGYEQSIRPSRQGLAVCVTQLGILSPEPISNHIKGPTMYGYKSQRYCTSCRKPPEGTRHKTMLRSLIRDARYECQFNESQGEKG